MSETQGRGAGAASAAAAWAAATVRVRDAVRTVLAETGDDPGAAGARLTAQLRQQPRLREAFLVALVAEQLDFEDLPGAFAAIRGLVAAPERPN
jgi:hypothetical protein